MPGPQCGVQYDKRLYILKIIFLNSSLDETQEVSGIWKGYFKLPLFLGVFDFVYMKLLKQTEICIFYMMAPNCFPLI